jgi:Cof subfamily protein (haloacid dehalogenase superfamily)
MGQFRLLIADVDGTLLTSDKVLTDRSVKAVRAMREAGIAFAVTSGRPPRGMGMLVEPLELVTPIAAFNGGMLVRPDFTLIERQTIPVELVTQIIDKLAQRGLDVWLYRNTEWLLRDPRAPHVEHEQRTVRFPPLIVPSFDGLHDDVVKIVGVSDDLALVARTEQEVRELCSHRVSAARSQPYYLDVTHPNANKGAVVKRLARMLEIPSEAIATIGDMPNDVLMFSLGCGIAMGNASCEVQRAARFVTTSNDDEGFARAVERFVL